MNSTTTLAAQVKDIEKDMQDLTRFMAIEKLEDLLRRPLLQMGEPALGVIPSLHLSGDGAALASVLLVTPNFLCEIHVNPGRSDFDYMERLTVRNYRFALWTHELKEGDTVKATFYLAKIIWAHSMETFRTEMEYVGPSPEGRDAWIGNVLRLVPLSSILKKGRAE